MAVVSSELTALNIGSRFLPFFFLRPFSFTFLLTTSPALLCACGSSGSLRCLWSLQFNFLFECFVFFASVVLPRAEDEPVALFWKGHCHGRGVSFPFLSFWACPPARLFVCPPCVRKLPGVSAAEAVVTRVCVCVCV